MDDPAYLHGHIAGPLRPAIFVADILDMLADVNDALVLDIDVEAELLEWINEKRASVDILDRTSMPLAIQASYASQAIADIIARFIHAGDLDYVIPAERLMRRKKGWSSDPNGITLFIRERFDRKMPDPYPQRPCILAWLGPDFDADQRRLGVSAIK